MVEITKAVHSDLHIGDCGIIEDVLPDGYAVRVHGEFAHADKVNTRVTEDRTLFVPFDAVKTPDAKIVDEGLFATLQILQAKIEADRARYARTDKLPTRS